jgi:hypothetical protein
MVIELIDYPLLVFSNLLTATCATNVATWDGVGVSMTVDYGLVNVNEDCPMV